MTIEIIPLTGTLGAEIRGIDMADVDDTTRDDLRKAWLDHKVLVVRDQHISTEEHIAFGRLFGELEEHPFTDGIEGHPEIVVLHATNEKRFVASGWHSDVTWREEPSMGSILRGVIVPPLGGDTCFADGFTSHGEGVSEEESEAILRQLRAAIMNPSIQCRVRWDVDTFVMWDNRCTQHCATDDFFPAERRMERVTVIGDRPF